MEWVIARELRPQNGSRRRAHLHQRRRAFCASGRAEDLLRNAWRGFLSPQLLPDGTISGKDEPALRALIAESAVSR